MSKLIADRPVQHAETLDLINTEVSATLARQYDAGTRIDTKAVVLVGYAGAASSFLATRHAHSILSVFAYITYGMAVGFGIWSYGLRSYQYVPNPRRLLNEYWTRPKAEVLAAVAASRVVAFESNARQHRRKARLWWLSLTSLAAGLTLMILALTSA